MDSVGENINASNANWSFKSESAKNFDSHVSKSVPLYIEGHQLICNLSDFFVKNDSVCYEIGCSTGALTVKLASHNKDHKPSAQFIGIDVEQDMIEIANNKFMEENNLNIQFTNDDILQYPLQKSDLIVAYYTIQFIRPSERQRLIDIIYESLNWGGAFILFEKVRASDARFQDIMVSLYNDYKLQQGYTPEQIFTKAQSLKGILEPFSSQGNYDLLKRAGFIDINSIFKYVCFEGILAIK